MPYTRPWSNLNPLGTAPASSVDDEIRNVRLDVNERMDTLLGAGKWATDPVAVLTGYKLLFPGQAADTDNTGGSAYSTVNGKVIVPSAGGVKVAYVPLIIPVGYTITDVTAIIINGAAVLNTGFTFYVSGVATGIVSSSALAGGITLSTGGIAHVVTDSDYLIGAVDVADGGGGTADATLVAIRVTYTKPNIL